MLRGLGTGPPTNIDLSDTFLSELHRQPSLPINSLSFDTDWQTEWQEQVGRGGGGERNQHCLVFVNPGLMFKCTPVWVFRLAGKKNYRTFRHWSKNFLWPVLPTITPAREKKKKIRQKDQMHKHVRREKSILTLSERDPHYKTYVALQKTPPFLVLQTWSFWFIT